MGITKYPKIYPQMMHVAPPGGRKNPTLGRAGHVGQMTDYHLANGACHQVSVASGHLHPYPFFAVTHVTGVQANNGAASGCYGPAVTGVTAVT